MSTAVTQSTNQIYIVFEFRVHLIFIGDIKLMNRFGNEMSLRRL